MLTLLVCSSPPTARRHWWIICVHSKHTKGLDKRRINIQAYRQKRQETRKESGREETQKRGNEKKPVTITKAKDKGQCFCGHNTAWRCFQIVLFVMFQLQSEKKKSKINSESSLARVFSSLLSTLLCKHYPSCLNLHLLCGKPNVWEQEKLDWL